MENNNTPPGRPGHPKKNGATDAERYPLIKSPIKSEPAKTEAE